MVDNEIWSQAPHCRLSCYGEYGITVTQFVFNAYIIHDTDKMSILQGP